MKSIKVKPMQSEELELLLPVDRVVEIDEHGRCSLYDRQILITDNQIEEVS